MSKKIGSKAIKKLIDFMGGIEKIHKSMEQHKKDFEYFSTHHQELLKNYPEEWVAIYNKTIIWHNKDFLDLIASVDKEVRSKAVVQRITAKKMTWILAGVNP